MNGRRRKIRYYRRQPYPSFPPKRESTRRHWKRPAYSRQPSSGNGSPFILSLSQDERAAAQVSPLPPANHIRHSRESGNPPAAIGNARPIPPKPRRKPRRKPPRRPFILRQAQDKRATDAGMTHQTIPPFPPTLSVIPAANPIRHSRESGNPPAAIGNARPIPPTPIRNPGATRRPPPVHPATSSGRTGYCCRNDASGHTTIPPNPIRHSGRQPYRHSRFRGNPPAAAGNARPIPCPPPVRLPRGFSGRLWIGRRSPETPGFRCCVGPAAAAGGPGRRGCGRT